MRARIYSPLNLLKGEIMSFATAGDIKSNFRSRESVILFVGFMAVSIASGFILFFIISFIAGMLKQSGDPIPIAMAPWIGVTAFLLSYLGGAAWAFRYIDRTQAVVAWHPATRQSYIIAVLLSIVIAAVGIAVYVGPVHPDRSVIFYAYSALLPIVVAPFVEEVIFRGAIFSGLRTQYSIINAILLTTVMFLIAHLQFILKPIDLVPLGLLSLVACWLRIRYSSTRPCVVLHIIYNFLVIMPI